MCSFKHLFDTLIPAFEHVKDECDINQQDFEIFNLHFVKSESSAMYMSAIVVPFIIGNNIQISINYSVRYNMK